MKKRNSRQLQKVSVNVTSHWEAKIKKEIINTFILSSISTRSTALHPHIRPPLPDWLGRRDTGLFSFLFFNWGLPELHFTSSCYQFVTEKLEATVFIYTYTLLVTWHFSFSKQFEQQTHSSELRVKHLQASLEAFCNMTFSVIDYVTENIIIIKYPAVHLSTHPSITDEAFF